MKKILLYSFLLMIGLSSCKKDNDLEHATEKSFQDPEELLGQFTETINSSENGWIATLRPKGNKLYSFFVELDPEAGELSMLSDINEVASKELVTSDYRLQITESVNASLVLGEGSYMDVIELDADGRSADSIYSYRYTSGDTISLLGNRYGDELILVKATAEQSNLYKSGQLASLITKMENYFRDSRYMYLENGDGSRIQISLNPESRAFVSLSVGARNAVDYIGADYSYTATGIRFRNPVVVGETRIDELVWDDATGKFSASSKGKQLEIKQSNIPVIPLHYLLGYEFNPTISLPSPLEITRLPGWSDSFFDTWMAADAAAYASPYRFILYVADFEMNVTARTMTLQVYVINNNRLLAIPYTYTFTKSVGGTYRFTPSGTLSTNAAILKPYIQPILDVVANNEFRIEYYDATAQLGGLIGQFISVNDEEMYFTGLFGSVLE